MWIKSMLFLLMSLGCALLQAAPTYPQRSVRVIIPFPPGGAGDVLGRMVSARLGDELGQSFVNDNRPGHSHRINGTS